MRLFIALICAFVTTAAAAQDLANPGFEQLGDGGFAAGWERWPAKSPEPGAVSIDPAVARSGERSLRLHHDRANTYTRGQQVVQVEPNQRYYFRVWMKGEQVTPADGAGSMGARMYIEGIGGRDHATPRQTGTFGWKELTLGPLASGKGGTITVMCYLHFSTGTVWFDDVQVIRATPDFEKRLLQERAHRRFRADTALALASAEQARDPAAVRDLRRLVETTRAEDLPDRLEYRAGPPHFPAHAEVFRAMARVNARRQPGKTLAAWVDDPFAPLPVLGLVPRVRRPAVSVLMGTGERDQTAINLCNLGQEALQVDVSIEGLDAPGAPKVTLREAVHVETATGEMLADPLPRLRAGAGMDLPPGAFRQLWLDLSSAGGKPGIYRGRVKVRAAGRPALEVPLTCEVLPVALPDELPIVTWNYSYQHEPLIKERWSQARADLAAHHVNAYCWPAWLIPWPKFDEAGNLMPLDWTAFDAAVKAHDNIQWMLLWPQFEFGNNLALRLDLEPGSPLWEKRFAAWFTAVIAGLKERGFGYDRIAWYPTDEPTTPTRVKQQTTGGGAIRKSDPRALIFANPYSACSKALLEQMVPVTDIWCPELAWSKEDLLPFFQQHSKIRWTYQVLSKQAPAFERYRLSFWECWQLGITGHGFWAYAGCGESNWSPYDSPAGDYAVVYDGDSEELIPSKRWEAWREGVEDYTYLWLLRQRHEDQAAPLVKKGVGALLAKPSPAALAALREKVLRRLAKEQPR